MRENSYREDKDGLNELLHQYNKLREGIQYSLIDEDSFERIIDYYDDKDDLPSAMEAADHGIEQYPFSSILQIKKADLLIATRQYREALVWLEKAEILDRTDINLYILKTDAYLALDQQKKAAVLLEEAIDTFEGEDRIELLFELADVYDDYEEFDKVFNCLKLVLEQDPVNEEALYKICFWTDFTGRNEEGIKLHQQIIEEYPFTELAWFNLGAAYQGLKLYEKSIDAYQYAIAIDEKFDYAYRNMGDAYLRMRRYKDAIEVLQKVLELTRPEDVIYEAIGHCYEKMKNHAQARFHYRKASHLSPEDSHLYFKIASTYMNENHWESAIKNLESALRIHKNKPDYNFALAQCYVNMGKTKEAVIYFSTFIKSRPKNIKGWRELIRCLYHSEFYEEAMEQVNNAVMHTGVKSILIFYKSAINFAIGHSKEALVLLEIAMDQDPRLVKQFIELNPSILQNQLVADIISKYKKIKLSKPSK